MTTPLRFAVTTALAALLLAGCGDKAPSAKPQLSSPTSKASAPATETAAPSTGSASSTYTRVIKASKRAAFITPSGNIACEFADDQVRCDIREKSFTPPSPPGNCTLEFGSTITLGTSAEFACVGDTIVGDASVGSEATSWFSGRAITIPGVSDGFAPLQYGEALEVGQLLCGSTKSGVTCENANGHGFRLARASYEFFTDGPPVPSTPSKAPAMGDCHSALKTGGIDGLARFMVATVNARDVSPMADCSDPEALTTLRTVSSALAPVTALQPCALQETGVGEALICDARGLRGGAYIHFHFNSGSAGEFLTLVDWTEVSNDPNAG